jgi:hypothetical protein
MKKHAFILILPADTIFRMAGRHRNNAAAARVIDANLVFPMLSRPREIPNFSRSSVSRVIAIVECLK